MCGIGGVLGGRADPAVLARMAEAMAHRGPDGQAVWSDERCGLAFRRLAIIDLDERSMQPLHLGPLHLVFNGEIYDYRERRDELIALGHAFVTEGDGEVLLHAWQRWGEGALTRLNGMFAFAVYDERDASVTLCADAFGEKPVFWAQDGPRFAFASDIGAVREAIPALGAPDDDVLAAYLASAVMPDPECSFHRGVHRLPAAHLVRFVAGAGPRVRQWWVPGRVDAPARYEDAVERVRELLTDSIRLRLRADVPVGTSLSGGVDSSAIVCLSAALAGDHRRHAFTARFPGYVRDEWGYAEQVARAAGVVEHHAIEPTLDTLLADVDAFVARQEEPVLKLNQYAQWGVFRSAQEAGVTVLLDGQGADELFAGYLHGRGFALRSLGPRAALRAYRADPGVREPYRLALLRDRMPRALAARLRRGGASPYVTAEVAAAGAGAAEPLVPAGADGSPLRRELMRQAFVTSLPQLLRYGDRNSMAFSREVRLPFLDRRVAELALSLPADFLVRDGVTKAVLRDAVRGLVPDAILDRRDKVGFEPPQAQWLNSEPGRAWAAAILLDDAARSRGLYATPALEADVAAGQWRDTDALWRVLNAELWLRATS